MYNNVYSLYWKNLHFLPTSSILLDIIGHSNTQKKKFRLYILSLYFKRVFFFFGGGGRLGELKTPTGPVGILPEEKRSGYQDLKGQTDRQTDRRTDGHRSTLYYRYTTGANWGKGRVDIPLSNISIIKSLKCKHVLKQYPVFKKFCNKFAYNFV